VIVHCFFYDRRIKHPGDYRRPDFRHSNSCDCAQLAGPCGRSSVGDGAAATIERDREVLTRQKFHRPYVPLRLERTELSSFVAEYDPADRGAIFWLDYTNLTYSNFDEFSALITKLAANSMIKITLRAEWRDFMNRRLEDNKPEEFRRLFSALMPDPAADPPTNNESLCGVTSRHVTHSRPEGAASGDRDDVSAALHILLL
jgi:hypothetical protein